MKELDCVIVTVEKDKYAKENVHKGMIGVICYPESIDRTWLVQFDNYGEMEEIACISIAEEDLRYPTDQECTEYGKQLYQKYLTWKKENNIG